MCVKPIFQNASTWHFGSDGRALSFTAKNLAFIYCNPLHWKTYDLIKIGRNKFRIKQRDLQRQTSERFLKAIFVSPDPNSTDPDATIHEDRYGELLQIVEVSAMGKNHIILKKALSPYTYSCLVVYSSDHFPLCCMERPLCTSHKRTRVSKCASNLI